MPKVHRLTRAELYEKVWQVPIRRLAEEFGLSDRGLTKLCERHDVPTPPRGYWARLEAGQAVKKAALPELSAPQQPVIEIRASEPANPAAAQARGQEKELAARIGQIEIPSVLRRLHPVVAAWVEAHGSDQEERRNRRRSDRSGWPSWPQRADLTDRDRYRFRVTSAFLKAAEGQGARVAGGTIRGKLTLEVCGETVNCTIAEKMIQEPGYGQGAGNWTAYPEHHNSRLLSSGYLRFSVNVWLDGNKDFFEAAEKKASLLLPEFLARVLSAGPVLAERRRASELAAGKHRAAMAEQAERQRLEQIDAQRWEKFLQLADNRDRCIRLRTFVEELKTRAPEAPDKMYGRTATEWIEWAEARIRAMDPAGMPFEQMFRLR